MNLEPLRLARIHIEDTSEELDRNKLIAYIQQNSEREPEALLQKYLEDGYIEIEDGTVKLTEKTLKNLDSGDTTDLKDVYDVFEEFYHIGDYKKIDLLLATILSVNSPDKNIWILYVGASGIGKSMLTNPIKYVEYPENNEVAYLVSDLTTNTIVSGQGGSETDLAPKLDGKIMYVPDFSTIVGKRSEDQREIFSQLRNLYDGIAKKETGTYGENEEHNPDVSFIGNVTPAIHSKKLIHQSMGTRFLYYEIRDFEQKEVMKKIWTSEEKNEDQKSKKIAQVIEDFVQEKDQSHIDQIPQQVKNEVEKVAKWTAKMRASGSFDRYRNELDSSIEHEKPARILKQLKKIYQYLKKLQENYSDEKALEVIKNIGASSIDPDKRRIYIELDKSKNGLELSDLIDRIGIGRKAIKRRLLEMQNVGIIDTSINFSPESGQITYDTWKIKEEYEGLSSSLVSN